MLSRTDTNLLDLLTDPATSRLSNREISRRTRHDHHYVAGFRAALAALKWAPRDLDGSVGSDLGPGPTGLPVIPGGPSSGTRSTPGHTIAGKPPALNSYDCWVMATARERTKFIDAVGFFHLLEHAPADQREYFLHQVRQPSPLPARATAPSLSIPDDLSILRRIGGAA
jgi:hypothetical protein